MTFLIITDLHDREPTLAFCRSLLQQYSPEAVLCLGDLTERARHAAPFTEAFVSIFEERHIPLLCISGNNDLPASLEILEAKGCLIDNREQSVGDTRIIGVGFAAEAIPTTNFRGAILLTHIPPRRNSVPSHLENVPRFHFSGHFHSRAQTWPLGRTTVVQVPSAMDYRAALLHLPVGRVEFISLPKP